LVAGWLLVIPGFPAMMALSLLYAALGVALTLLALPSGERRRRGGRAGRLR
jgi:hypothetical protein